MKWLQEWYRDPLARFCAEGGVTVVLAWMFVYEYTRGMEYPILLYINLTALIILAVDVVGFLMFWLWERTL